MDRHERRASENSYEDEQFVSNTRAPHDDFLLALAATTHTVVVSGDHHLADLADRLPVYSPGAFLEFLPVNP